jgi:hypothetical protein
MVEKRIKTNPEVGGSFINSAKDSDIVDIDPSGRWSG